MKNWICLFLLALSSAIARADSPAFELKGSLAFATSPDQFLLAYSSNEISSGPNIYGRVLAADGTPRASDFRLSTQTGAMSKPAVAYSPKSRRFLVVWGRKLYDQDRAEIIGLSVGLNGEIMGLEFRISVSDLFDTRPAVSYSPTNDRFLVTWTRGTEFDYENGISDIYAQFVEGDAMRLAGSNFPIATAERNQFKSDVTHDEINDRFLILWEDQRNLTTQDDAYGQLLSSEGTMIGQNFIVSATGNVERRPVAAANTTNGTYLVVWESIVNDVSTIVSRIMDSNGNLLGQPVPIGADLAGKRNRPAVAYLKAQNVFCVVFYNSIDRIGDAIYAQFVEANGILREAAFALTTARGSQNRPDITTARNTFLAVWTDYRDTVDLNDERNVYEYYGRMIGNDMALSSRWKNPQSK